MLIYVTFQKTERTSRETEKTLKYTDLTTEKQHMRNIETKVIPVIIGATDTISNSFRKYLSNIAGKHNIKKLQNTTISGTVHMLWTVPLYKYRTFIMGITLHLP
jgi:hypothetical protein